jgi:hypothetical protein
MVKGVVVGYVNHFSYHNNDDGSRLVSLIEYIILKLHLTIRQKEYKKIKKKN